MFEGLRNTIMLENLIRIRNQERQIERDAEEDASYQSEQSQSSELNQRMEMFRVLIEDSNQERSQRRSANSMAWSKCARLTQQIELLQEELAIQSEQHQRQLRFEEEKHQREVDALKAEVEKHQCQNRKLQKEENMISSLKKQIRQLYELQGQKDQIIQRMTHQLKTYKNQSHQMRRTLKDKEEQIANLNAFKHLESDNQKKLKENLERLNEEMKIEKQKKKHAQNIVNKLKQENEELIRESDKEKVQKEHEKQLIAEKYRGEITRLEDENKDLKTRNQKLEESFIDHLTQTSLNLQQNIKQVPDRTKTSSLYLNETPIRTRSKGRERVHTPPEEQDPQKSQCIRDKCHCSLQLQKLKDKLRQANGKIVELLQEKGQHFNRQF